MAEKKLTGDPRQDYGWFSRRHETAQPHHVAQLRWAGLKGPGAKAERLNRRTVNCAARTPQEQIALLDQRLGVGQGATKERARLAGQIGGGR